MTKTVAVLGTFDTKGHEFAFVRDVLKGLGLNTLMIHCGAYDGPFTPDVSNAEVAEAAGVDIETVKKADRAFATEKMSLGVKNIVPRLYQEGRFDGILSFGGSGGTTLACIGMRELPIGVPKIMVSTIAGGNVAPYVGESDIIMVPSIVDISGINMISGKVFTNAAKAMAGMLLYDVKVDIEDKPLIAATMFGVTTPCVDAARKYLEEKGYEVLVFHATGTGGRSMEKLVSGGYIAGVLDLTTTEWCDELCGGILRAGPHRLEAAGKHGVPQVVSVGALDMVNFGPPDTVPEKYKGRNFYQHNPTITLMRTNVEENKKLGEIIAEKLNMTQSPTALMLPLKSVSALSEEDNAFYGREEDEMLFHTLRSNIDQAKVELIEMDNNINDTDFAIAAADKLIALMGK